MFVYEGLKRLFAKKKIVSVSILSRSSHFCFAKLTRPKYKYKVQVGHNNNKNKYAYSRVRWWNSEGKRIMPVAAGCGSTIKAIV